MSSALNARIVVKPCNVAVRWLKTGLFTKTKGVITIFKLF